MFGIIADLIAYVDSSCTGNATLTSSCSSATTILLPAWLACKAIRSSDPAQLTPWLIYFVLLALALLLESWTVFIIGWFPFYSWIRLGALLWLVLPQTQGAKYIYITYLSPFIVEHERQIDEFIGDLHNTLQSAGLGYLGQLLDFIREKALGQPAPHPGSSSATQDTSPAGYAQSLMSRFAMPDARTNAASLYGMLSNLSAPTSPPTQSRSRDVSAAYDAAAFKMPAGSSVEKSNYIASERARLAAMLHNLEKEQQTIDLAYGAAPGGGGEQSLPTSRSEASFESISHSDILPSIPPSLVPGQKPPGSRRTPSGNWVTSWFSTDAGEEVAGGSRPGTAGRSVSGSGSTSASSKAWSAAKEVTDAIQGMSSGVEQEGYGGRAERRY